MHAIFRSFVVPVALLGLLAAAPAGFAQSANLTLLHINDVYEISPKKGKGGMAQLMTLLEAERARAENHLTTLGGDLISPSVMSGLTQGAQMIDAMNAIGLDLAGFGNHEFDFGPEVFAQRMKESKFTWLATNTVGPDGKPFGGATATMTRKVGELTVGLFSVLTPETEHLSSPGPNVEIAPAIDTAKSAVASLKDDGADFIIALTHLDIAEDRAVARAVKGVDVILGGHDHDPISFYESGTLILKAEYDAHYLLVADIAITKKKTRRGLQVSMVPQWRFLSTAGVAPHGAVAQRVAKHEAMTFTYDPKAIKGSRGVSITVGGRPLDDGKRYSVATNDYIANGGDGYAALKQAKTLIDASAGTLMATQVMEHITKLGTVAPEVEGRIMAK